LNQHTRKIYLAEYNFPLIKLTAQFLQEKSRRTADGTGGRDSDASPLERFPPACAAACGGAQRGSREAAWGGAQREQGGRRDAVLKAMERAAMEEAVGSREALGL